MHVADIRATISQYLQNHRELSALYGDIPAIRRGFKCRDFSIYHGDLYVDFNPNYYIGSIFYEINRCSITIMKNIYECSHFNCYRSDDILWYDELGIRITKKYNYIRNYYINHKYNIIIYISYHIGYITINDIVIYNPQIYDMIQNAQRLYKLRYRKIIDRFKK
jgi:hypothetical protein